MRHRDGGKTQMKIPEWSSKDGFLKPRSPIHIGYYVTSSGMHVIKNKKYQN
jgi:hypothetical protein